MSAAPTSTVMVGHAPRLLRAMPAGSVHCVVTSPPYWGLREYLASAVFETAAEASAWASFNAAEWTREYGDPDGGDWYDRCPVREKRVRLEDGSEAVRWVGAVRQCARWADGWRGPLGLEPTPEMYIAHLVEVFEEVRRVLRDDGTLWLNLGDCYATGAGAVGDHPGGGKRGASWAGGVGPQTQPNRMKLPGLKPKDLVGIPWMAALALRSAGWFLRQDIIWAKPNPMPESCTDRPTTAHEHLFLLAKRGEYYYDATAIREPITSSGGAQFGKAAAPGTGPGGSGQAARRTEAYEDGDPTQGGRCHPLGRNKRSVWSIPTYPFPAAHFATFPPRLVEPCILAGTSERGCCGATAAPMERVTERSSNGMDEANAHERESDTSLVRAGQAKCPSGLQVGAMTVGWKSTCGAPVERLEKAEFIPQPDVSPEKGIKKHLSGGDRLGGNGWDGVPYGSTHRTTTGWSPTCSCGAETVPCVVLDTFGGSGTTNLVAKALGRSAISIEANPEYARMARERIARGGDESFRRRDDADETPSLFGEETVA